MTYSSRGLTVRFVIVRLARLVMIVALLTTTGVHWALLQSVAWTAMLTENLHHDSIEVAVQKTFDGQHACSLCKVIAAGKTSEKKPEFSFQSQKLEFQPLKARDLPVPPSRFELLPVVNSLAESFGQKPLLQPPRGFFV